LKEVGEGRYIDKAPEGERAKAKRLKGTEPRQHNSLKAKKALDLVKKISQRA
jgi:hypothetical protein